MSSIKHSFHRIINRHPEIGVITVFLLLAGVFTWGSENFLTWNSLTSMFTVAAEVGIVAVGITLFMNSGEFDI